MGWLIFIVAVAVGAWWFGKQGKAPVVQPPALPVYDDYHDMIEREPIEELGPDEREARRAHQVFEAGQKARSQSYHAKKDAIRQDERKLAKARDLIETSYLSLALPYVQDETKHWPSWSKMDASRWTSPLPIADIDGSTRGGIDSQWVQFRPEGGSLFKIEFERSRMPSDDEKEYATMKLFVDGGEVLGIGTLRNWTKEYDSWRFATVDCLRVGPWMSEFVDFYGKLRAINEGTQEDHMNDYVIERAAKIDLGDAVPGEDK